MTEQTRKYCMLKVNTPSRRCEEIIPLFKLIIISKATYTQIASLLEVMNKSQIWEQETSGLLQQELIVILMKVDIPIIITRNAHRGGIFGFKLASPQLLRQLNIDKHSTSLNPRLTVHPPKHLQTLSSNTQIVPRTRRISSSAAAKRFPKDFFKDENCFHPIKSLKNQHKHYDQSLLDAFNSKSKLVDDLSLIQKDKHAIGTETPNFKQKIEVSVRHKISVTDYESWEKANNQQTKEQVKKKGDDKLIKKGTVLQITPLQQCLQKGQPLNLISNFNLTLGQKINVALIMKKQHRDKRRKALCEKQNCSQQTDENIIKGKGLKGEVGFRIRRKILAP